MYSLKEISVTEIVRVLSTYYSVDDCLLYSMIKVGGKAQYKIFKRISAALELMDAYTCMKPTDACKYIEQRYNYSRSFVLGLKSKYPEHFFDFNCK